MTRAKVMRLGDRGELVAGSERWFETDIVATSFGFSPANEIARTLGCAHRLEDRGVALSAERNEDFETTVAGVFVVGDCAGLGGARAAIEEGTIAGAVAAQSCGVSAHAGSATVADHRTRLAKHRRFQRALWRVYESAEIATQLCTDETVVCRCEEVTLGEIKHLIAAGAVIGNVKRQCRAGMGRCQGRYCSYVIQHLQARMQGVQVDELSGWAPRMPFKPVSAMSVGQSGE